MKPRHKEIHRLDFVVCTTMNCIFGLMQRILKQHGRNHTLPWITHIDYTFQGGQGKLQNIIVVKIRPDSWKNTTVYAYMLHQERHEKLRAYEVLVEVKNQSPM